MSIASAVTPLRIAAIDAARSRFRAAAFDDVGLRDIAAGLDIDVGRIMREFGSKEALFAATFAAALEAEAPGTDDAADWPGGVARALVGGTDSALLTPFRLVAFSAASPTVEALIRSRTPELVQGLAAHLEPGEDLAARAAVATVVLLGLVINGAMLQLTPRSGEAADVAARLIAYALDALRRAPPAPLADPPRGETREEILKAAVGEFSRLGYDHATVRGIAAAAGVDPALVIRHFTSKEDLFHEALKARFATLARPSRLDIAVEWLVLSSWRRTLRPGGLDITLRSASSPVAREVLKEDIRSRFHAPFARQLGGDGAELRANLITAVILGVSFARSVLRLEALEADPVAAMRCLQAALVRMAADD